MNKLTRILPSRRQAWMLDNGPIIPIAEILTIGIGFYVFYASQTPSEVTRLTGKLIGFADQTSEYVYRANFQVELNSGNVISVRTDSPRLAHSVGERVCLDKFSYASGRTIYRLALQKNCAD